MTRETPVNSYQDVDTRHYCLYITSLFEMNIGYCFEESKGVAVKDIMIWLSHTMRDCSDECGQFSLAYFVVR